MATQLCRDPILLTDTGAKQDDTRSGAAHVSEKLSMMETGQWGAVWALVETKARDKDQRDTPAATMRRVEGLLEAGEISRAAAAV